MRVLAVFLPHLLGITGLILWIAAIAKVAAHKLPWVVLSLPLYLLVFLIFVALIPNSWLSVKPTTDQNADTAIILGFGYVMTDAGMKPGRANQALLDWTLDNKASQLRLLLLQEGVWVASDETLLGKLGIERARIHRHDPALYVNTLDTAYCAIRQLQAHGKTKAILVAHNLQLQRVAWDFDRVSAQICPDCTFVIPDLQAMPYTPDSVHWQTRNEFFYKITEVLVARPRDLLSSIPTECKAPLDPQP